MSSKFAKFYHFTSPDHLPYILRDGFLKLTESNVGAPSGAGMRPEGEHVGPDVVWLIDRPQLGEQSHGLISPHHDKTAVRVTVQTRAIPWLEWQHTKRMHMRWREAMIRQGGGPAASRRWWITERAIAVPEWKTIHVRDQFGEWELLKEF